MCIIIFFILIFLFFFFTFCLLQFVLIITPVVVTTLATALRYHVRSELVTVAIAVLSIVLITLGTLHS